MSRPDFTLPTAPTAATVSNMTAARPALPAAFGGSGGARFSSTFLAVQSDVAAFIQTGSPAPGLDAPASGLTADGAALRARLSGAAAIGGTAPAEEAAEGADTSLQQQFLASIRPYAEEAGAKLGVAPELVAAHAALESGWGQRPLRQGGVDSNNLFGVKAGSQWQGGVAAAATTEYEGGVALHKVERFRSYPDQASAFRDYASLLADNPRYHKALNAGSDAHAFARGLAQGGYATDPGYAAKLASVARRISSMSN
ncbi:glycoside hydrolase family 73 protein [Massilia endophytica]|uniref:glycoside hydrolase family 73 protein n=1 Tax=Massilia endophytica TaxID=2899220 RepID=UPI001E2F9975|nr:glucosaminidase domain-containing protein [Massilia endophytica]UGQ48975.1 glucosaminidase domain-containing protein [Massilia endophytica]